MGLSRPGFSVYLPLAYPSLSMFSRLLESLAPCVDFFEIGLPSPRPKYDGPVVRQAHRKALGELGSGSPLDFLGESAGGLLGDGATMVLMTYLDDHPQGLERVLETAKKAGFRCVLFPDLLFDHYEETPRYVAASQKLGLGTCFFVSSRFPHRVMQHLASQDPLFIYLGLQPATGVRLPVGVERNIAVARRLVGDTYLLAGFAVRDAGMARRVIEAGADAVVVGSALLRKVEDNGLTAAVEMACRMKEAVASAGLRALA